ncbi:hypothetical protein [Streptomyces sp. NPDC058157]|uniref:hypothetical protein n=1 Tax=Streptomyces sp. NPDC058157 TaxID=3346360 RepID=UPI0036ED9112
MSCLRRPRPSAAAVFALVLGVLALVLALAGPGRGTADQVPATATAAVHAASAAPAPAPVVFTDTGPGRGPVCAPGSGGAGTEPAVPARAGHEHGSLLVARAVPEGVRPYRAECVRVPVRGPDRRAPGPVELNVMRV